MKVRAEIGLAIGALLSVQVATSFGAIALLSRMSPAIAQIIDENLYSIEAVDEMLMSLTLADADPAEGRERFERALARAESNITEPDEHGVLAAIRERFPAALAGDVEAQRATARYLQSLARINHASTRRMDAAAQSLGGAGAWAAALLGAVGFVLSGVAISRLTRTILRPTADLGATVSAFRQGDLHRRSQHVDMPHEFRIVAEALDDLLDSQQAPRRGGALRPASDTADGLERRALVHLLSQQATPALLVDTHGRVRAAGAGAMDLLADSAGEQDLLESLRGGPDRAPSDGRFAWTRLKGGYLCVVSDGGSASPEAGGDPS